MRRVTATFNLRPCVFAHVNEMSSKVPKWWNQSTGNGARVNVCVHVGQRVCVCVCQGADVSPRGLFEAVTLIFRVCL